jgi:hypothetical protein
LVELADDIVRLHAVFAGEKPDAAAALLLIRVVQSVQTAFSSASAASGEPSV